MFTLTTPLRDVFLFLSGSEELRVIRSLLFPQGPEAFSLEADLNTLGMRHAYNAMVSLNLIEEELQNHSVLLPAAAPCDPEVFFFFSRCSAPTVLLLPAQYEGRTALFKSSGIPIASELVRLHMNCAVLNYRAASVSSAVSDIRNALCRMALFLDLPPADLPFALFAFADGGTYALQWLQRRNTDCARPRAEALASVPFPSVDQLSSLPPTYLIHGARDALAPIKATELFAAQLRDAHIPSVFRAVPDAADNFGKGFHTSADGWLENAAAFVSQYFD